MRCTIHQFQSGCLLAKINGKRAKGSQQKKYMDCLVESFSGQYKVAELVHLSKDRLKWRFMIASVTRQSPWIESTEQALQNYLKKLLENKSLKN